MYNAAQYTTPQPPVNAHDGASAPPQYMTPEIQKTENSNTYSSGPVTHNPPVQTAATMQTGQGSVVPLYALSKSAAMVHCPRCSQTALTTIDYKSGSATHAAAAFCCCMTILCTFVPYFFSGVKDVQHRCAHCHTLLATWHRSSGTEVHISPTA